MLKVKIGIPGEIEIDGSNSIAREISKKFKGSEGSENQNLLDLFIQNIRYLNDEELKFLVAWVCREYQLREHRKNATTFMR